jgi:hypothetical protein
LDFFQLLSALRILARRLQQEFGVDLDDGEQVVQLVGNEAGRLVRLFEIV